MIRFIPSNRQNKLWKIREKRKIVNQWRDKERLLSDGDYGCSMDKTSGSTSMTLIQDINKKAEKVKAEDIAIGDNDCGLDVVGKLMNSYWL